MKFEVKCPHCHTILILDKKPKFKKVAHWLNDASGYLGFDCSMCGEGIAIKAIKN